MKFTVKTSSIFNCSIEKAFKTPMLCDITKIHTGFGFMPKVISTNNDENWGKVGSSKRINVAKSIGHRGGFASVDKILERVENDYWKIQVDEFQLWKLGFYKFVGIWRVKELEKDQVLVEYQYDLYAKNPLLYFFNWVFAKTFWKIYMNRVMENIRKLVNSNEPYQFK